jgi:tRNA pseudouridine38-40 synthase
MKYLISISYDGSKYHGLQKLKNEKTVQGELEKVLTKMNGEFVQVKAAGRTDRGVHALDQKCHFELDKKTTPFRLRYYIDRETSPYLYVKDCTVIDDEDFHARFSVKSKTYLYKINTGAYDPINADYVYNYNKKLNIELMKNASKLFVGSHDYRAFVIGKHKTCESIIDSVEITNNGDLIEIEIKGKAFYTYMVRCIVQILVLVGAEKIDAKLVREMLDEKSRKIEYSPAPAGGLYLKKIEY